MNILVLEPYYGGSHQAFLDGWKAHSRHDWTLLTLPPYKWKWRMRHAAVTFIEELESITAEGFEPDLIFCTDMLDVAALKGLMPPGLREVKIVLYFHENQLTYPVRNESERDYHFGFTNMTSALAADEVWFNSAFHRDSFMNALGEMLKRVPDFSPDKVLAAIREKSEIRPQGIAEMEEIPEKRPEGPIHILWAARWEFDKAPEVFFDALDRLVRNKVDFRLAVIGEQFRETPPVFDQAKVSFQDRIDFWGYQESRDDYIRVLQWADVMVSTAVHEFFGIGVVEAAAAGAFPVLPDRLSYPELFDKKTNPDYFYGDGAKALARRLEELAKREDLWNGNPQRARKLVDKYCWPVLAPSLDEALDEVLEGFHA